MKNLYIFFVMLGFFLTFPCFCIFAQVGINADNTAPDASSMLDVKSSNKGFLPPRMATTERDLIQNPSEGLTIYNTDLKCIESYAGSAIGWRSFSDSARVTGLATTVRYNGFTNMQVFDTPGTFTFSITQGEMNIMVEVWGGGGGAFWDDIYTNTGSGGGGGGYGKGIWHFVAPSSVLVTVGEGTVSGNGGTSSFGNYIYATGGQGATLWPPARGGTSNGTFNLHGRVARLGGGGDAPYGGYGGINNGFPSDINGGAPGGGASVSMDNANVYYGSGGNGRVVIYW